LTFLLKSVLKVPYTTKSTIFGKTLKKKDISLLTDLSVAERSLALSRFNIIRPYIEDDVPLAHIAHQQGICLETARTWVNRYHQRGLAGLARKRRSDRSRRRVSKQLSHTIEGLALKRPPLSAAAIHRAIIPIAHKLGEKAPSYSSVYASICRLDPGLLALAHEGPKSYSDSFDLIHRTEAKGPNVIWQADHTVLDVLVDDCGKARKPWLTIILDDYSRAVAGYALSFAAPSALQTALALRQGIWRKTVTGWNVCGIPDALYTDHGSDFTSRHLEQVAADLKIQLIFSAVARPRGGGKIERFFRSLHQVLLCSFPGYAPGGHAAKAVLTLADLTARIENYLIHDYHMKPHRTTGHAPQVRWDAGGFLPRIPESVHQLDLLLMTVAKSRRVRQDGIHFMGFRYMALVLGAYIGEEVMLRYDPRDMAEVSVFYGDKFLCRAICQELAGETIPLREIVRVRKNRRRELRNLIDDRRRAADAFTEPRAPAKREQIIMPRLPAEPNPKLTGNLKRYADDD
jgi:putative transposase